MGGKTSNESKAKYNAKAYDRVNIAIPKGQKGVIQAYAEAAGQSINGYVVQAVNERIDRDNGVALDIRPATVAFKGDGAKKKPPAASLNAREIAYEDYRAGLSPAEIERKHDGKIKADTVRKWIKRHWKTENPTENPT